MRTKGVAWFRDEVKTPQSIIYITKAWSKWPTGNLARFPTICMGIFYIERAKCKQAIGKKQQDALHEKITRFSTPVSYTHLTLPTKRIV